MGILAWLKQLFGPRVNNCKTRNTAVTDKSFSVISSATSLARATIETVTICEKNGTYNYLFKYKETCLDTVIFSCFLIRALCIMSSHNHSLAYDFSKEYIDSVISLAKIEFHTDEDFEKIFNDRADFYDRVFVKKTGIHNKIPAIIEEFEYIIKSDIIENGFALFSENSPLPILGIFEDMQCRNEVSAYFQFLLAHVDHMLKNVMEVLK